MAGDVEHLEQLVRTETDPELRADAIRGLALTGHESSSETLLELYAAETDPEVRESILEGLFTQGNVSALIKIAREEKDPQMRATAVRFLAMTDSKKATDFMLEILDE